MGNLRDRAREIRQQAELERGNFEPAPGSLPLRAYQFWARHSSNVPERENFCHYWRVVVFWAPVMWLNVRLMPKTTRGINTLLGVTYAIAIVLFLTVFGIPELSVAMMVVPWLFVGIASGIVLGNGYDPENRRQWLVGALVTFPVAGVLYAIVKGARAWRSEWNAWVGRVMLVFAIGFGSLGIAFVVYTVATEEGWMALLYGTLIMIASVAALAAFFGFLDWITARQYRARMQGGSAKRSKFAGVADAVVFTSQVVRVKKWKICPMVTIPEETK